MFGSLHIRQEDSELVMSDGPVLDAMFASSRTTERDQEQCSSIATETGHGASSLKILKGPTMQIGSQDTEEVEQKKSAR